MFLGILNLLFRRRFARRHKAPVYICGGELPPVEAEQGEEEAGEDDFDAEHEAGGRGQREAEHAGGGEVAEAGGVPQVKCVAEDAGADEQQEAAEQQAGFEGDVFEDAIVGGVAREEAFLGAEDAGGDGEDGDVRADEDQAECVGEGVDVEGVGSSGEVDGQRAGEERGGEEQPDGERGQAGIEEEPARAVEQQEAEVTPAVDLTTISEANSMPVVRRLSARMRSRRKARRPQWKSPTGMRKKMRPAAESTGLPR